MNNWHTKLEDCAIDLLTLVEDQIALANNDPAKHQRATIAECGGAISCLMKRLAEDDFEKTKAMLTYSALYGSDWLADWNKLAKAPVSEFLEGAAELQSGAAALKAHFERQRKS